MFTQFWQYRHTIHNENPDSSLNESGPYNNPMGSILKDKFKFSEIVCFRWTHTHRVPTTENM